MYDAQQGSTSGAHIDMSTASGTNDIHGSAYVHRGTDWLNAAPYFFKDDPNIPANEKVPRIAPLHRRAELWAVRLSRISFSDISAISICTILTRRSALREWLCPSDSIAQIARQRGWPLSPIRISTSPTARFTTDITASQVSPIALALMQYKLPNGQFMIPNDDGIKPTINFPENAIVPGPRHTSFPIRRSATSTTSSILKTHWR